MNKQLCPVVLFFLLVLLLTCVTALNVIACECAIEALGVKIKHCSIECNTGASPCCGCGLLSSSCVCCEPGYDCKTGSKLGLGVNGTATCEERQI